MDARCAPGAGRRRTPERPDPRRPRLVRAGGIPRAGRGPGRRRGTDGTCSLLRRRSGRPECGWTAVRCARWQTPRDPVRNLTGTAGGQAAQAPGRRPGHGPAPSRHVPDLRGPSDPPRGVHPRPRADPQGRRRPPARPAPGPRRRALAQATGRRWRKGSPSRSSRTTASTRPSPSRRRPSVTAATTPRLRCDQARHRLVDRVGGQQVPGGDGVALADAVAAVLGLVVHRGRPLELEEGDVRRARERDALARRRGWRRRSAAGRPGSWKARTAASRAAIVSRPSRCSASGKRSSTASCTSTWRAKTTSGSPEARKSWIHASAACSLPRAASRCSVPSCARRSARSVAAIFALSSREVERLLAQPGDHVLLGQPVLALVVERDRHDDLALGGQLRQHLGLQPAHEAARGAGASAGAPRSAAPRNWRLKRAPRAEVLQPADARAAGGSAPRRG